MSITISNLTKVYGTQKAVDGISLNVNKGEITGFLGPNGAGKSTTMKMITGFLQPDGGSIEVCGLPVSTQNTITKKKIGYLPEANPLYIDMYVREYLQFICGIHQVADATNTIEAVIKLVGLTNEAHKKTGQLSKGYKQRVGLAAALVHNPDVLILDEPTSGLDPNQIVEIRNVIKSLAADKTILFSSHIMQEVEAICDRVIIINKGKIVANDRIENLRSQREGSHSVSVSFTEDVQPGVLDNVSGVEEITALSQKSFILSCKDAEQVKKQLLQLSIDKNLNIESLQSQSRSLEAVFKSLTTS